MMLRKCVKIHQQRRDIIFPIMHACSESRSVVLKRYSMVPLRHLLVPEPTMTLPGVDMLDPMVQSFHLAVDWKNDSVVWNASCPIPEPHLPWTKYFCDATRLCIPMDDMISFTAHWDEAFFDDLDELLEEWAKAVLPCFAELKEVFFILTDLGQDQDSILSDENGGAVLAEISRDNGKRRAPYSRVTLLASNPGPHHEEYPKTGPLRRYTRAMTGDDRVRTVGGLPWWEALLEMSRDPCRRFQKIIERDRPDIRIHVVVDAALFDIWIEEGREDEEISYIYDELLSFEYLVLEDRV